MIEHLVTVAMVATAALASLKMVLMHREFMGDSAAKGIQEISARVEAHVAEVKLVTTALNERLTQLANKRQ